MPSGEVHDRITIVGAAVAAPVWWFVTARPPDWTAGATLIGATLFSGLMLSPDLDLDSSIYRRWGPLRFLWWPYKKAIPHRSRLSHSFILAPLLRLAYFLFLTWALFRVGTWVASLAVPINRNQLSQQYAGAVGGLWHAHPQHVYMFLTGLFLGTALHVGADVIVTGVKQRGRGRRRRRR